MSIQLYNTRSRTLENFETNIPQQVKMYVCGYTVQASPHIGHIRSAVVFDVIRRWLIHSGYQVTFIRNITDIDDKIITAAHTAQIPWWQLAYKYELEFQDIYQQLNVLAPDLSPRATGYIPQMISYIQHLISKEIAYVGGGDVYFAIDKLPSYGKLSGQNITEMQQGETLGKHKRNILDFALWKAAKPGEPAWETPWGSGRPGWHLECTVMATELLGDSFDIHGGGRDLLFPHHENELAQAAGNGKQFANYWMHNGMLNMAGQKMSKSLGNVLKLADLLENYTGEEVRYYFLTADYRTNMDFSLESLQESATAFRRLKGFVTRVEKQLGTLPKVDLPPEFIDHMDNDFSTSAALAVAHSKERAGNKLFSSDDLDAAACLQIAAEIKAMLGVLGIDLLPNADKKLLKIIDYLIPFLLEQRNNFKQNQAWEKADKVRQDLQELGIEISDTARGTEWMLRN